MLFWYYFTASIFGRPTLIFSTFEACTEKTHIPFGHVLKSPLKNVGLPLGSTTLDYISCLHLALFYWYHFFWFSRDILIFNLTEAANSFWKLTIEKRKVFPFTRRNIWTLTLSKRFCWLWQLFGLYTLWETYPVSFLWGRFCFQSWWPWRPWPSSSHSGTTCPHSQTSSDWSDRSRWRCRLHSGSSWISKINWSFQLFPLIGADFAYAY